MKRRILLIDSDWQLLNYAYSALRKAGYDVIAESDSAGALHLIRTWKPNIAICPVGLLEKWQREVSDFDEILPGTSRLITAHADESAQVWQGLAACGHEILLKPVTHYLQLHTAIESALRAAEIASSSADHTNSPIRS